MQKPLEAIHHLAIQVTDISQGVTWYTSHFSCAVTYQDNSWALLKFQNISLALVLPGQHPPHFAVTRDKVEVFGQPIKHRDGTISVYVQDPSGNQVEILQLNEE